MRRPFPSLICVLFIAPLTFADGSLMTDTEITANHFSKEERWPQPGFPPGAAPNTVKSYHWISIMGKRGAKIAACVALPMTNIYEARDRLPKPNNLSIRDHNCQKHHQQAKAGLARLSHG